MSTRAEKFAGLSVAIVTPFRDGAIDTKRLHEQVDFQAKAGVTCICPVGTTGESPTLTHDEHERVIAESIQAAAGRLLVMPGTGSNSTAEAIKYTQHAENRTIFASGAVKAAEWLVQQKAGQYNMQEVLGL
jgi:4-hydroxy-tetrahydrodipicolinate synthase